MHRIVAHIFGPEKLWRVHHNLRYCVQSQSSLSTLYPLPGCCTAVLARCVFHTVFQFLFFSVDSHNSQFECLSVRLSVSRVLLTFFTLSLSLSLHMHTLSSLLYIYSCTFTLFHFHSCCSCFFTLIILVFFQNAHIQCFNLFFWPSLQQQQKSA